MSGVEWPYSTLDEVSHLCCSDVQVLRARIDQLLEERRVLKAEHADFLEGALPDAWEFTPSEERLFRAIAGGKGRLVARSKLHVVISEKDEPDTDPNIVNVILTRVRRKIANAGVEVELIASVWGKGYKLTPEGKALFGL